MNKAFKVGDEVTPLDCPIGAVVFGLNSGRTYTITDAGAVGYEGCSAVPTSPVRVVSLPTAQPIEVEGCKTWEDLKDGDTLCGLRWVEEGADSHFHGEIVPDTCFEYDRSIASAMLRAGNKPERLPDPEPEPEEPDTLKKIVQDLKDADFDGFSERLEALIG